MFALAITLHHGQVVMDFFFVIGRSVIDVPNVHGCVRGILRLLCAQYWIKIRLSADNHLIKNVLLHFRPSVEVSQTRHVELQFFGNQLSKGVHFF